MKKLLRIAAALALAVGGMPAVSQSVQVSDRSPDHVLVWTRDIDKISASFAVKLGFQVRPGGDFGDGIANRLIRFPNRSYLELLYFTAPGDKLEGQARKDYEAAAKGTVANNFGIQAADVDLVARQLRAAGWKLEPETPMTYDPDGPGPLPARESLWRSVGFPEPPLSASDVFFIHYRQQEQTPTQKADSEVFTRHPNGALRISSIWLLSADPEVDAARLARLGFKRGAPVTLTELGLRGTRFAAGAGSILVLQPSGPGPASDALKARGPHLHGVGVEVADLERARRVIERGYGTKVESYTGVDGTAVSAPTHADLGFIIEFHSSSGSQPKGEQE